MTCGDGQNFWQRLMTEGKQSSKVFRPLTHPGRESLCHMGRQHAHASTPKGFEPLRAEPNGFLVHLLSHSDTVFCRRSALAPNALPEHFCPSAKEANDE